MVVILKRQIAVFRLIIRYRYMTEQNRRIKKCPLISLKTKSLIQLFHLFRRIKPITLKNTITFFERGNMATLQLMIKKEDEISILGPRKRRRSVAPITDKIIKALITGYTPPQKPGKKSLVRIQMNLPGPILKRLEDLSKTSGMSLSEIVRNILGLKY